MLTNTAPTVPYRGAGRPEAVYLIERLIAQAAREMRLDPAELRRRNLIAARFPYQTKTGWTYDSGNYPAAMQKCQALADWAGYPVRQQASAAAGRLRGRGIVYYTDNTGIFNERMELRFDPCGELTILAGTLSHGQGHETAYTQMASEWLGVPTDKIRLAQGDTDEVAIGRGTYASRSMMVGGSALRAAADEVIERGKRFAAHFMEADAADVAFADGQFTIAGTDRSMPLEQVAQMSFIPMGIPSANSVLDCRAPARRPPTCRVSRTAATSANSRSIRIPGRFSSTATRSSTISARWSTHCWRAGRSTAVSRRALARRLART